MIITLNNPYKSLAPGQVSPLALPTLVVITGANGSGKTSLLEALANGSAVTNVTAPGEKRFFPSGSLTAADSPAAAVSGFRGSWRSIWSQIQNHRNLLAQPGYEVPNSDAHNERLEREVVVNRWLPSVSLEELKERSHRERLLDVSETDFQRYGPHTTAVDPFQLQVTEQFLRYHARRDDNRYQGWLHERYGDVEPVLADEEFETIFGPPPWDLVNEALARAGLRYAYPAPTSRDDTYVYDAQLRHLDSELVIQPSQLSAGQRVMAALALAGYAADDHAGNANFPKLILFDEPDASLHPEMVKSMLSVVEEVLVLRAGAHVILTTHSPTTVALSPEASLFEMTTHGTPRLQKVDRERAVANLCIGLPTLSISVDARRQVFTESPNDQQWWTDIYRYVRGLLNSPVSLEFISSGRGGHADKGRVKNLVSSLRGAGNDRVWGLVDSDNEIITESFIESVPGRYAIENIVLDPLLLGVLLLQENILKPQEIPGLTADTRTSRLSAEEAAILATAVGQRLTARVGDSALLTVTYMDGLEIRLPSALQTMNGHALYDAVLEAFPGLRRFNDRLLAEVINRVLRDHPSWLPSAAAAALQRLTV